MLAVQKWAKDKNPLIAFFAINYALAARERCGALQQIKDRRIYNHHFLLPDLPSWFALYRSRKPLFAYKRLISGSSDYTDEILSLMSGFRKLDKAVKHSPGKSIPINFSPENRELALKFWQELCSMTYVEIMEDIANTQLDSELKVKFRSALKNEELSLSFYFLVYAPCLLFYHTTPATLYRKALNKNISAIENLLRIDPLTLHDPDIGFQIQSVRLYGKANDYERLLSAISKHPAINYKDTKDERRSIKSDFAASILVFAESANQPLKASQIRALFDAFAQDYEGTLIDADIKSPEGFDKTIRTKAAAHQKTFQSSENQK